MQVLVVGGTGTLGRQVARRAIDQGHKVRCMVRSPRKAHFLQEWGCELTRGDLLEPDSLAYALEGQEAVIDAATARPSDPVYTTDWDGTLNLLRACDQADVRRFVFVSLLGAHQHRAVPLMDIKACLEDLLADSNFDYTILRSVAFMQGVIGQFAIPVLENQTVWVSGTPTPIAYMNTQDVARFAVAALERPQTIRQAFPVVGPKAWSTGEIVQLCERDPLPERAREAVHQCRDAQPEPATRIGNAQRHHHGAGLRQQGLGRFAQGAPIFSFGGRERQTRGPDEPIIHRA